MSKKEIIIDREKGLTRVAVMEDDELCEFYLEREGAQKLAGNIYKGRVQNVLPGMQAAFVDIGAERNAFLYVGDAGVDQRDFVFDKDGKADGEVAARLQSIRKAVKSGQEIMVQVIKEPDGTKGARITTHITLPGRYVVLVPMVDYVGVSRRIREEGERQRLKAEAERVKPEGMGLIVRTAAEGLNGEDFLSDIADLTALWREVEKRFQVRRAPCCIHQDEDLLARTVRDLFTADVERVVLDDACGVERVREALASIAPELADRVEQYQGTLPIFDAYRIESRLDKALAHKVWLKNGGYLYVDQTEALTVIDVNTGKFVGSLDLQDTVFQLNCEAAKEIARQVRLRDLGGIIIIDFIDMESPEHQQQVVEALREALKKDRNKTNVVGLTGLGLVEMTRKKMRKRLSAEMEKPCPFCGGTGRVMQEEHTARRALRDVRRIQASGTTEGIVLCANATVLREVRALAPVGGIYLRIDGKKGAGDYHVSTEPAQSLDELEFLS